MGKIMRSITKCFGFLLFFCLFAVPRGGLAGEPTAQLSASIDEFVTILTNTPVSELRTTGLPEKALKLILQRFDFSEMTQLSLGTHWKSLNAGQQKEFVDAFTQRILVTYGRTVRSSGDEKILYQQELQNGKQAQVATKVVNASGGELPIDYQLHEINGQWKVYDVTVDSVSMVKNFREQFQRIIARSSLQELLKTLKERSS